MSNKSALPTVPPFQSKLPPEFIEGLDERGKYLYQTIDKITQMQDWITEQSIENTNTLLVVKEQTIKTNGRLSTAEADIKEIKLAQEAAIPAIKTVNLSLKIVKSKWFWGGAVAFITFVIHWLISHNGLVIAFLKLLIGA